MQFQLNKLALAAGLLVLAGVLTPLFLIRPWDQPSREMQMLRNTEQKLDLLPAEQRQEDDAGRRKGKDGATHNSLRITNFYNEALAIKQLENQMRSKGWAVRPVIAVDGKTSTILVNLTERTCAELRTSAGPGEQESDGPTNRVVLMSESDDACSGYVAFQ